MQTLSKISKQTLWQVLGKVVTTLSTVVILGMIARKYGQSGTGIFTLALTYLSIFYLLSDFGFNAHILRQGETGWHKLLGTRIIWSIILSVFAVGLLPFWPFATPLFNKAVIFGSLAIIFSGVFTTCNLIFQSRHRYDLSVLAATIGTLTGLGLEFFIVFSNLPVPFLVLGHLFSWIVICLASLLLLKKILKNVFPIFDIRYSLNLFKDSWLIAATLAINVVYFRADAFMLVFFKGVSEVGIYNVAYSVFQSALVIPTFIMNAYYPMMLKSLEKIKGVGFGLVALAILGTALTFILAPTMIKILAGHDFDGASQSLQILSLGFPAYFLSSLLMWFLVTKGRYKTMLTIYLIGLIFNLGLNYFYIPTYSYMAASWITVVSEYLILILQVVSLAL